MNIYAISITIFLGMAPCLLRGMEKALHTMNGQLIEINAQLKTLVNKQQPITVMVNQENNNQLHAQQLLLNQVFSYMPDPRGICNGLKQYFMSHKYKIIFGTCLSIYASLLYIVITGNRYLKDPNRWVSWKYHMTVEELYSINQKDLMTDLLKTIQQRYFDVKNPTNYVIPLARFVNAIEQEINIIKYYGMLGTVLKRLHLLSIMPLSENSILQAQQQLQRLNFIKHIFLSWATTYSHIQYGIMEQA